MLDSSTSIQWLGADILTTLVFLPSLGALVLLFLSNEAKNAIRAVGLLASGATLAVSVLLLQKFDPAIAGMEAFRPLLVDRPWIPRFGIRYLLGVDGLSLVLVVLTTLLTLCVLVYSFGQSIPKLRGYVAAFLVWRPGWSGASSPSTRSSSTSSGK
jgi:NADH-quinone oxidoreductase subunit M